MLKKILGHLILWPHTLKNPRSTTESILFKMASKNAYNSVNLKAIELKCVVVDESVTAHSKMAMTLVISQNKMQN